MQPQGLTTLPTVGMPSHGLQGPWKQGTIPGLPNLQQGHIYRQFPYTVLLPRTLKTNLTAVFLPEKKMVVTLLCLPGTWEH